VRWFCRDGALWRQILVDWRATFGRHSDACYSGVTRSWSLPLAARSRLLTWADAWFPAACQRWDDEEEPAPASIADAYAALFLRPGAPPELVQAAHRIMVKLGIHGGRCGDLAGSPGGWLIRHTKSLRSRW
jgi:hypothetical protein